MGLAFANVKLGGIVFGPIIFTILFTQPHVAVAQDLLQGGCLDIPLIHKCSCLTDVIVIGHHSLRVACVKFFAVGLQRLSEPRCTRSSCLPALPLKLCSRYPILSLL